MTCVLSWKVEMQLKKLSQWSIIFYFFCLVLFYYYSYCFYYLLFLLFLEGVPFGNGNESNFALNFRWTQMNIQLVCFFITFTTKKKTWRPNSWTWELCYDWSWAKIILHVNRCYNWKKIMAFTMVREGIRFTQGKELGQLRCRVKTRGSLSKKSF